MSISDAASAAILDWRAALGEDNVAADGETLGRYGRTTLVRGTRPVCIIYPTSTEQVQEAVRIASRHGVVVYPISRGRNWGYGDACAPTDGAAVLDLSRMNRIVEVNTELAYTVIEPGVSQQQLQEYLRDHDTGLCMDSTGAGLEASLVGNTVDRGFGHTRYGDHFLTACGMEVVLADGRVLNTGYSHYPQARAERVYRYGVGPFLDGLFCQSNLGIVTKIGLWLAPRPEAFNFFFIKLNRFEELGELVDRLRPLRLASILNSAVHIANDLRLISANRTYPWDLCDGKTPLPGDMRAVLRKQEGVGAWTCCGSLTGTKAHVKASRKALRKAMGSFARVRFVDDTLLALGERAVGFLNRFGIAKHLAEQLRTLKPNYGLLRGVPTDEPLRGAQWRVRGASDGPPCNPLDAGCGLMWASPVVPMTGRDALRVMELVEPHFAEHGFELLATFTLINERAMVGIMNAAFDATDSGEAERASACYDAVFAALMEEGYVPYRVGLTGLPKLRQEGDLFWEVAGDIKKALDPGDIIARGRYVAPLEEEE